MAIAESLGKCAPLVERVGQGEWNFVLNNGSALLVGAKICEHWIQLDAPVGDTTSERQDAWRLLKLNRGLGGLSKIALLPRNGQPDLRVRTEIPLDEDVDLGRRLLEACAGLKSAAGRLHGEEKEELTRVYSLATAEQAAEQREGEYGLRNLCEETGWKFTERTPRKMAIDLETRARFYQAIVEEREGGGVSVAVEVAGGAAFGESSRRAIGTLLLRASAEVRLVRGVVSEGGEGVQASFEALFQTRPCAAELGHTLSALAVACGLCGGAVEAMQDEVMAGNYLAAQGLKLKPN